MKQNNLSPNTEMSNSKKLGMERKIEWCQSAVCSPVSDSLSAYFRNLLFARNKACIKQADLSLWETFPLKPYL